jgi:phosphoglycolate/pyridoxal phosphate phosphatase family enzyme
MGAGLESGDEARPRLVALDLDGVVWRGNEVFPGVREALEDALSRGLDLRYVSNNSAAHREAVSDRLAAAGLPAGVDRVLTSGFVCGAWLRTRLKEGCLVLVVGEAGLVRELREAGFAAFHVTETPGPAVGAGEPAAVVVGMDRTFNYKTLAAAQAAIRAGALYVATNGDVTFPTANGLLPGAGALVAAVSAAAEREPVLVGKPSMTLAETLAAVTGVPAGETLFVGDRLSTDIAMAKAAGMMAALTLTGVTTNEDLWRAEITGEWVLPDHVLDSLADLPGLLDRLDA